MRIHPATESTELNVEVLERVPLRTSTSGAHSLSSTGLGEGGSRSCGISTVRAQFLSDAQFVEQSFAHRYTDPKLLLVTQALKEELDAEAARELERTEREKMEESSKAQADALISDGTQSDAMSQKKAKGAERRLRCEGGRKSGEDLQTFHDQLKGLPAKRKLRVYRPEALEKLEHSTQHSDSDVCKRNAAIFKELQPKGAWRRVDYPRNLDAILALEQTHPHFSEVIRFVADRMALAKVSRRPVGIPPMLLAGPAGVGKTHFCEALGQILGVPVRRHPMDQAETSSALLGSEVTWGNTRVGLVFEMLARGDHANPVVILDELDKARGFGGSADPTAVLHSLLEPVSAGRVRDQSVEMELDASLITWIATCNYPWLIAPTLRSRMRSFDIRMPDAEQAIRVAHSVVASATKDAGVPMPRGADKAFVLALAHLNAREIYQLTGSAIAQAVRQGRGVVSIADLPAEVRGDDSGSQPSNHVH